MTRLKVVCTIEARMRSSRLPGKVLLPVMGRPMLALMIERLRRVPEIDEVVVATTTDPSCEPIVDLAQRLGVASSRGSEDDVLDRVLQAARAADAGLIVEMTGDCPLIDPAAVSRVIHAFRGHDVDYCSNVLERTYPRGMDVQVFPLAVLEEVARLTDDPVDHEHVSIYIYRHPERFRLLNVASGLAAGAVDIRLTVDTPEDFAVVSRIYEHLYPRKPDFTLEDILDLLAAHPALGALNRDVKQKEVLGAGR